MFRNVLAGAALMLAPMTALAQGADQFEGFYGGVQLGYFEPEFSGVSFGEGTSAALVGGYNHAIAPNMIVGAEVTIGTPLSFSPAPIVEYTLEDMIQFRARSGFVTGDVLWYGVVGYHDDSLTATGGPSFNADGWAYGLGAEWMFAENWSARLEYQTMQLDIETGTQMDFDSVHIGVLFHF